MSQTFSMIWVLHYFVGKNSLLGIHLKNLVPDRAVIVRILLIGSAPFAMQLAASVVHATINKQLLHYGGDIAISIMGVIFSITTIILMPIFGINQGTQPIVGYNYGAKLYHRVRKAMGLAIIAATAISTTGWLAAQFFTAQIISLFDKDGLLLDSGIGAIRTMLLAFPFVGFQIVTSSYFQAVGKPRESMFLSLSRQVLFLIPLLYLLPHFFSLTGVFAAGAAADFLATLVTAIMFIIELRHLKNRRQTLS